MTENKGGHFKLKNKFIEMKLSAKEKCVLFSLAYIYSTHREDSTLNKVVEVYVKTFIKKTKISDDPRALIGFLEKLQKKKLIKILDAEEKNNIRVEFLVELFPKEEEGNYTMIYRKLFKVGLKPQLILLCIAMQKHEYKANGTDEDWFKV